MHIEAYTGTDSVAAEVTFVPGAGGAGTIGLYTDEACTTLVSDDDIVDFQESATSSVVSFGGLASGTTYYIGVYIGDTLTAVKAVTTSQ